MAISEYFTDEELISNLRLFFNESEMWDTDFRIWLNNIEDLESCFYLKLRGREFVIDKITGSVEELNPKTTDDEEV